MGWTLKVGIFFSKPIVTCEINLYNSFVLLSTWNVSFYSLKSCHISAAPVPVFRVQGEWGAVSYRVWLCPLSRAESTSSLVSPTGSQGTCVATDFKTSDWSFFLSPVIGIYRKSAIRLGLFLIVQSFLNKDASEWLLWQTRPSAKDPCLVGASGCGSLTETVKLVSEWCLMPWLEIPTRLLLKLRLEPCYSSWTVAKYLRDPSLPPLCSQKYLHMDCLRPHLLVIIWRTRGFLGWLKSYRWLNKSPSTHFWCI